MKKRSLWVMAAVIAVAAVAAFVIFGGDSVQDYSARYAGVDLFADVSDIQRDGTYSGYLADHESITPACTVELPFSAVTEQEGATVENSYNGRENVLLTEEKSRVTWQVEIPQAGFYNICLDYCPVESRGINIERCLLINGQIPFSDAQYLTLSRLWTDAGEVRQDNQGNDIRPSQKEVFSWVQTALKDNVTGYETEPFCFWFDAGVNTLTLQGVSEPMAIGQIRIQPVQQIPDYTAYIENNGGKQEQPEEWYKIVEGEDSVLRSDPSLYASYDRASANTVPYSASKIRMNMAGGDAWSVTGQWIEWEVEVPSDGFYNIHVKGRQNYERGQNAVRSLYIDGKIPFEQASEVGFQYSNTWEVVTLGDGAEAYRFYLTEGKHTIRLEVSLGSLADVLGQLEDSVFRMNQIYRELLVLMGRNPDKYRDYDVESNLPGIAQAMELESQRLYYIIDQITEISGGKNKNTGSILRAADLLAEFSQDTDVIKKRLSAYRDSISAIGTAMQSLSSSKLDVDYLAVSSAGSAIPEDVETVWSRLKHEVNSFIASFTTDYDAVGNVHESGETLEVWIVAGRDQANILKTIIDDDFTPNTGISVNLKLVESGAVLSAVVAGTGPNLVLTMGGSEPVNYALRNAVEDLTQFEDFAEVAKRFDDSAFVPYEYDGGVYGLPETQSFSVMFYRKDILQELGLEVPETWDDMVNVITELQLVNMEVGLPDVMKTNGADLAGFYAMLYQNGCSLYNEDGSRAALDSEGAIKAFEDYSRFYTQYQQPENYDFADRFRAGEMPIGMTDFTMQNKLAVFAPELKGLWGFTLIPGTVQEDGTVDHSVQTYGNCAMMLKTDDQQVKQQGWELLKWWTSADVQTRFGTEVECILGASGRYATANLEAFSRLSWSSEQLQVLTEQRSWGKANREIPGGYYTSRHIINALRRVVNDLDVPRETLLDYNQTINEEIIKKRKEFGLD